MPDSLLLDPVRILQGPGHNERRGAALIEDGVLQGFDQDARDRARQIGVVTTEASNQLIAPCLVDPHSVLENPVDGRAETLQSLKQSASAGGYGSIALLPRSPTWRDRPARLQELLQPWDPADVQINAWGSFSRDGQGNDLAPHADLIDHGAIGIADDDVMLSSTLLERGLLLGEVGAAPVLLAPRDPDLQGDGMARACVETLRAGWVPDPLSSECLPVSLLLALQRRHPQRHLILMNLSTAEAVEQLRREQTTPPAATVSWWHLLADSAALNIDDPGWRVRPSLGTSTDRLALQQAVADGLLSVAVHAVPLDEEDILLPPDQRPPGLSGHHLVLSALWDALIHRGSWSVAQLWNALSFGPSTLLNLKPEQLEPGSPRWLLFDPECLWTVNQQSAQGKRPANVPLVGRQLQGKVVSCGLNR